MIGQVFARLKLLYAQGVAVLVGHDRIQASLLDGETLSNLRRVEPYGLSYRPLPGAEPHLVFPSGDRSYGVALIIDDRRYRLTLAPGEVALHDDLGQKVHLTRDGVLVSTSLSCRIEARDIVLHASHSLSWDVGGYGERWTAMGGASWEHKTWQQGATVAPSPGPINPPEGP